MTATLTFVTPPPGFAPHVDFSLTEIEGAIGLFSLQAAGAPELRLFVLDASTYVPDYHPEISDEQAASLGLTESEQALVLVVANPGTDGSTTTNLMAPIVINGSTGACAQFILDNQEWPLRAELARA